MSAFTLYIRAEPGNGSANSCRDYPSHPVTSRELDRAKRNRANCSSLSGKRFDATEDRGRNQSADAAQLGTEVMHPKSISRELALENQNRPGIA